MAKRKTQQKVRTLTGVGVINAQGRNKTQKLPAKDQVLVETPRGCAELSRDLCAKYGCKRILLVFDKGEWHQERTASGQGVDISPMGRHLLEQLT